jgi:LPXTG-motif cell wall-anchored protein
MPETILGLPWLTFVGVAAMVVLLGAWAVVRARKK